MNEKDFWNWRYAKGYNSGAGSYGEQLEHKLKLLTGLGVKSIAEIGCGDFNFGSSLLKLYPDASYIGYDVSDFIVKKNRVLFPPTRFSYTFEVFKGEIPPSDLLLCMDVLFHILDDAAAEKMLTDIGNAKWKYLALTAYEYNGPSAPHVKIRTFNHLRFGVPIIREVVEEDGTLYFYLYKRDD